MSTDIMQVNLAEEHPVDLTTKAIRIMEQIKLDYEDCAENDIGYGKTLHENLARKTETILGKLRTL